MIVCNCVYISNSDYFAYPEVGLVWFGHCLFYPEKVGGRFLRTDMICTSLREWLPCRLWPFLWENLFVVYFFLYSAWIGFHCDSKCSYICWFSCILSYKQPGRLKDKLKAYWLAETVTWLLNKAVLTFGLVVFSLACPPTQLCEARYYQLKYSSTSVPKLIRTWIS